MFWDVESTFRLRQNQISTRAFHNKKKTVKSKGERKKKLK